MTEVPYTHALTDTPDDRGRDENSNETNTAPLVVLRRNRDEARFHID
jgi:hypothetical protein